MASRLAEFKTRLRRPAAPKRATWSFLLVPANVSARLPARGLVSVDGTAFQATLEPDGQGGHWLKVPRSLREAAGAAVGDTVTVGIAPVEEEPEPSVPTDLRKALAGSPQARGPWHSLSAVARRDWIFWITSAMPATTSRLRCSLMLAAALAITACSNPREVELPAAPSSPPGDVTGTTVGGDGSAIELRPLADADVEGAALAGELACSFSDDGGGTLLLAKGNVASDDASRGVVSVAGYVEPVAASGGFDAMLRGARFSGAGKVILVELTGPAIGGGESPSNPATLTYQRADGAKRTFAGQWQCGP